MCCDHRDFIAVASWYVIPQYFTLEIEPRDAGLDLTVKWSLKLVSEVIHRTNYCPNSINWVKDMQ